MSGHLEQVHVFLLLLGKYKTLNASLSYWHAIQAGIQVFKICNNVQAKRKLPIVFTGHKAHFYADCQKITHHENNASSEHC